MNTISEKTENRILLTSLIILISAVFILAILGFLFINKPDEIIQGQAEGTIIKISGKLPGRIEKIYVKEGDTVEVGDTLVHIQSTLLEAKLMQAQALTAATEAQNRKVDTGTRYQIIQAALYQLKQAQAANEIAQKTYERLNSLYNQGVISKQKHDEALAAYKATQAGEKIALNQYNLAQAGAQLEDKESAAAMVVAAKSGEKEVEAILEDQYLFAPCNGIIDEIFPQRWELTSLGTPIMNILQFENRWITFNVREELLHKLPLGKEIQLMIPALNDTIIMAKVFYIHDMGDYAVWRATKTTGEWDSRTFKIKAHPIDTISNLRPGMSIIYKPT